MKFQYSKYFLLYLGLLSLSWGCGGGDSQSYLQSTGSSPKVGAFTLGDMVISLMGPYQGDLPSTSAVEESYFKAFYMVGCEQPFDAYNALGVNIRDSSKVYGIFQLPRILPRENQNIEYLNDNMGLEGSRIPCSNSRVDPEQDYIESLDLDDSSSMLYLQAGIDDGTMFFKVDNSCTNLKEILGKPSFHFGAPTLKNEQGLVCSDFDLAPNPSPTSESGWTLAWIPRIHGANKSVLTLIRRPIVDQDLIEYIVIKMIDDVDFSTLVTSGSKDLILSDTETQKLQVFLEANKISVDLSEGIKRLYVLLDETLTPNVGSYTENDFRSRIQAGKIPVISPCTNASVDCDAKIHTVQLNSDADGFGLLEKRYSSKSFLAPDGSAGVQIELFDSQNPNLLSIIADRCSNSILGNFFGPELRTMSLPVVPGTQGNRLKALQAEITTSVEQLLDADLRYRCILPKGELCRVSANDESTLLNALSGVSCDNKKVRNLVITVEGDIDVTRKLETLSKPDCIATLDGDFCQLEQINIVGQISPEGQVPKLQQKYGLFFRNSLISVKNSPFTQIMNINIVPFENSVSLETTAIEIDSSELNLLNVGIIAEQDDSGEELVFHNGIQAMNSRFRILDSKVDALNHALVADLGVSTIARSTLRGRVTNAMNLESMLSYSYFNAYRAPINLQLSRGSYVLSEEDTLIGESFAVGIYFFDEPSNIVAMDVLFQGIEYEWIDESIEQASRAFIRKKETEL